MRIDREHRLGVAAAGTDDAASADEVGCDLEAEEVGAKGQTVVRAGRAAPAVVLVSGHLGLWTPARAPVSGLAWLLGTQGRR